MNSSHIVVIDVCIIFDLHASLGWWIPKPFMCYDNLLITCMEVSDL